MLGRLDAKELQADDDKGRSYGWNGTVVVGGDTHFVSRRVGGGHKIVRNDGEGF